MTWFLTQTSPDKIPYYFYVVLNQYKGVLVNSSGSKKIVFKMEVIGSSQAIIHQAVNQDVMHRFHDKVFDSGVVNTHMYAKHMVKSSEEAVVNVLATMYGMTAKIHKDGNNEAR